MGRREHREASISGFVSDHLGDQTQQMVTGPSPCVLHPQGINYGISLVELMIWEEGTPSQASQVMRQDTDLNRDHACLLGVQQLLLQETVSKRGCLEAEL